MGIGKHKITPPVARAIYEIAIKARLFNEEGYGDMLAVIGRFGRDGVALPDGTRAALPDGITVHDMIDANLFITARGDIKLGRDNWYLDQTALKRIVEGKALSA